jgi:hypothetical protein
VQRCIMPVQYRENSKGKPSAYILCDKRDDITRVEMDFSRLAMHRFSIAGIAGCLKRALETGQTPKEIMTGRLFYIGMASQRDVFLIRGINQPDTEKIIALPAIQQSMKPLLLSLILAENKLALPVISLDAITQFHENSIAYLMDLHLLPSQPRPQKKRGAKQRHNWAAYKKQFAEIVGYYGIPSIDEPELRTQAALENKMTEWGEKTFGEAPSSSRLRLYLSKWLNEIAACN